MRAVPYLRVANVQRGYLDIREIKKIDALETDIDALRFRIGDVLFNEGGDRDKLGRGWIWQGELPECIHQDHDELKQLFARYVDMKLRQQVLDFDDLLLYWHVLMKPNWRTPLCAIRSRHD